jgi:hypothetical protein
MLSMVSIVGKTREPGNKMKITLLAWLVLFLAAPCFAVVPDPGIPDTVRVESLPCVQPGTSFKVDVNLFNDEDLAANEMCLGWNSQGGDMRCDSVIFTGTRVASVAGRYAQIDNTNKAVHLGFTVLLGDMLPPGSGLFCKLYFSVAGGIPNQVITIDKSTRCRPSSAFIEVLPDANSLAPQFAKGTVVITTVCQYIRGDANGDGHIDVGDVVFLVNHIFKLGPAPNPLIRGDANCDNNINVGDPVYLLNYIFKMGPAPC